jgi:hypothetical protein
LETSCARRDERTALAKYPEPKFPMLPERPVLAEGV